MLLFPDNDATFDFIFAKSNVGRVQRKLIVTSLFSFCSLREITMEEIINSRDKISSEMFKHKIK